MKHLVLLCVLAACNVTDDRPQTLAYITETILAPNCASAECHSSMKRQDNFAFDTVAHAQDALASGDLIQSSPMPPCTSGAQCSRLITLLTADRDRLGRRMPLGNPLPNKDIYLIAVWIDNGAEGYVPPATPRVGNE